MSPKPWANAKSLREQVQGRWDRGLLLGPLAQGAEFEPIRLSLRAPSSRELSERFAEAQAWVAETKTIPHIRLEWETINPRLLGPQRVPVAGWLDSLEAAAAFIGEQAALKRFLVMLERTRTVEPALLAFLARYPMRALGWAPQWAELLAVCGWLKRRPRPGIYTRQVDLPGIHSKFIDQQRAALNELLPYVLSPGQFDVARTASGQLEARFGFSVEPMFVRFRSLDPDIRLLPGVSLPDVTLDARSFQELDLPARRIVITENKINFLTLPPLQGAIALFGAGYGFVALKGARWLNRVDVVYWGDVDTHGFRILDQLRCAVPHATSILMDEQTLVAHQAWWGSEETPTAVALPRLTSAELAVYDALRTHAFRPNLRLEQEYVGFEYAAAAFSRMP